jgi:hypothetical protein
MDNKTADDTNDEFIEATRKTSFLGHCYGDGTVKARIRIFTTNGSFSPTHHTYLAQ